MESTRSIGTTLLCQLSHWITQFSIIVSLINCMTEFLMVEVLATMKLKGLSSISLNPNYSCINFFISTNIKFWLSQRFVGVLSFIFLSSKWFLFSEMSELSTCFQKSHWIGNYLKNFFCWDFKFKDGEADEASHMKNIQFTHHWMFLVKFPWRLQ